MVEKHRTGRGDAEWLVGPSEAEASSVKGLEWAGLSDLAEPYEIVRRAPDFGHVLACFGGEGAIWAGGGWRRVRAGMVFVNPPGRAEALRAVGGKRWRIAWAHVACGAFAAEAGETAEPFLEARDGRVFRHALEGLRLCLQARGEDSPADAWRGLVLAHALRLAARREGGARLARVWEEVEKAPAEAWDVERLRALAGMSREHLRRVAMKETGRTPMEQVAYLRMRRAAGLLRFTRETLEVVAEAVGYRNASVFSNAFRRILGVRPGAYRAGRTERVSADRDAGSGDGSRRSGRG